MRCEGDARLAKRTRPFLQEASVPEASMADAVAAPGPVDPAERRRRAARKRYVTGTTFAIDRLWTDHRGSFDVMLKRSKGLRFLVEVFQDLCFVDGECCLGGLR